MTEPSGFDLLELATPYALNAVSDDERVVIDRQVARAPGAVASAFGDEVRTVREAMAIVAAATSAEPPDRLRAAVLADAQHDSARRSRWRIVLMSAAAAIILGLAAVGVGIALRPTHSTSPTMTEQIMAAPDHHTVSGQLAGGTATVVFSRNMNAGVLTLDNVPPPSQGTVYQMWLIDDKGPVSAGTMDHSAMAPSITHIVHDLGKSSVLAFTVEPGAGSPQPTGTIITKLPLG